MAKLKGGKHCGGLGTRFKSPNLVIRRPTHPVRPLLKNELPAILSDLRKAHPHAKIELWAQDEARIGLVPHSRRVWANKGVQPICVSDRCYEWVYLYAFVHPDNGNVFWMLFPSVNNESFELSLKHFAQHLGLGSDKRVLLVLDGAGFHRAKHLKIPDGIHLHFLPPYSPELQPAEQLWPLTHECHANRSFKCIEDLEDTIVDRCKWLQKNPDIIKGRTQFHWWPA